MVLLDDHFLGLRQDGSVQQHSQIASALRQMADQYQAQYATTKIAKKAKVAATLAGWLGEDDFPAALNLMHTRNYLELIVACPSYKAMAAAPKSQKMARLQ